MDSFKIHDRLIADYRGYIESFINIRDDGIRGAVEMALAQAVFAAYGWQQPSEASPALALHHAVYEVDYLPENDRVRYTIHPDDRKELLKRLLQLNHKLYAEEEAKDLHKKKPGVKRTGATEGHQEFVIT